VVLIINGLQLCLRLGGLQVFLDGSKF
jgi:hypothetical protein